MLSPFVIQPFNELFLLSLVLLPLSAFDVMLSPAKKPPKCCDGREENGAKDPSAGMRRGEREIKTNRQNIKIFPSEEEEI
jgi:hypothetical protein